MAASRTELCTALHCLVRLLVTALAVRVCVHAHCCELTRRFMCARQHLCAPVSVSVSVPVNVLHVVLPVLLHVQDPGVRTSSQLTTKSLFEDPHFPFFYYTQNWETTAWFDIHPLLPLQYWNQSLAHQHDNSSSVGKDDASGDNGLEAERRAAVVADDGTYDGVVGWTPSDWQPGEQQMCCEGRQWAGGDRPNQPTDCRRRRALRTKNFTAIFLERCAAGLQASGRNSGTDCR